MYFDPMTEGGGYLITSDDVRWCKERRLPREHSELPRRRSRLPRDALRRIAPLRYKGDLIERLPELEL